MTLHCHSTFSQFDGIGIPEDHAKAAKEQGLDGLALTDHSLTSGWLHWEKAMRNEGINPLFGVETYFAIDRHHKDKEALWKSSPAHLLLIAKNNKGLESINKIVSDAYIQGFYGKPRTDWSFLRNNTEGVIATSGCVSAPVGRFLNAGELDSARSWIADAQDVFGENFYLELQPHPFDQQENLNKFLCDIGENLIVTNDSHYATPDDSKTQFISACVSTKSTINKPAIKYDHDFSVKSYEQLHREIQENTGVPEHLADQAVENTKKLLVSTKVELSKGLNLIPEWPNANEELYDLLSRGLYDKVPRDKWDEYGKRLRYEYDIVVNKGFAAYFLVVQDMVSAAKERGVFVGCGRGSAGGSLVAYLLSITEVDPIRWDLDMERFISPNRGGYQMAFHSATDITKLTNEFEEAY